MVDFDGICSSDAIVLRNNKKMIDGFLPLILNTDKFWEYAISNAAGSMSKRVRVENLMIYEFPLPPIDEQRRIADLLWAADDSITEYQNILSATEKLELSLVAKYTQVKNSWEKKQIRELADVSYGLTVDPSRRNLKEEKPYLRVANVGRNSFDLAEVKNIGFVKGDNERYALQVDDILVVEGHANVDEIGRAALWAGQIEGCLHQNHILRIRVRNNQEVFPKYLLSFINSPTGKSYMRSRAKSTSGLSTINSTVLNMMEIPVPSFDEQKEMLRIISKVEKTKEITQIHLENSSALKKKLLVSMLGG